MAFPTILRRSASTVVPLAARIICGKRYYYYHAAAVSTYAQISRFSHQFRPAAYFPGRFFSSESQSSNEKLLQIIEYEIKCAKETDDGSQVEETPEDFPFKIDDIPGQQTITLTREYEGETITVEVSMPDLVTGDDEDKEDDDENDSPGSSIPLTINVAKKNGPVLEFSVTAFADEVAIDGISLKNPEVSEDEIAYEGPDFSDLDENLQKAFVKYLEIRGIKPSTTNFLHEYMLNKDSREYLKWLNNLRKFVEA